tara:strand:- start:1041 stop:1316 length:276 start_codon:yes stop_codon:yes gene_type:complete
MDLYHAARAVQAEPLQEREAACQKLMWQAHVADKHLKKLKKSHPLWGDGSLRSAALLSFEDVENEMMTPDLLACFAVVVEVLLQKHLAIDD